MVAALFKEALRGECLGEGCGREWRQRLRKAENRQYTRDSLLRQCGGSPRQSHSVELTTGRNRHTLLVSRLCTPDPWSIRARRVDLCSRRSV
jgi:hypothetical protein